MKQTKIDIITIRKSQLFYVTIAIVFFLVGFFGSDTIKSLRDTNQEAIDNCRKFCEFIPDTELSHVDVNMHCHCTQRNQRIFDTLLNKTLIYTKIVDVGIIDDAVIRDYIEQM